MKRDDEAVVAELSRAARRLAQDAAGEGPSPAAWRRLQEERARRAGARGRRFWPLAVAAACAVVVGVGLLRPRALTYAVAGGRIEANGYVRGGDAGDTEVRFSDGTRVRLARGTRMSVGTPGARGAHLRVEEGEAHFEVTHLPAADWSVEVGPYRVLVTGTVFDVRWSGADQDARVTLRAGSVRVEGPHLAAPVALAAGQRLVARLATSQVRIEPDATAAAEPAPANVRSAEAAPMVPVPPPTPLPEAPRTNAAPAPRAAPAVEDHARRHGPPFRPQEWAGRVARGEASAVLAEARARSLDDVLAGVDGAALAALADAARYSGEPALSRRVLGELRRRFPGAPQAAAAAFLLGRLADDRGDAGDALSWYRRYRDEAPRGPYAAEALGREMLAVERLSGRGAAAGLARDYLTRFPDGTYILQARAIAGLP